MGSITAVAQMKGQISCALLANTVVEEQRKGKRKRDTPGETAKEEGRGKIQNEPLKKKVMIRKTRTRHCHKKFKRLATERTNNGRAAGYYYRELDRYKRLPYGPALGTRSMTRWRLIAKISQRHHDIPNSNCKPRSLQASKVTKKTATKMVPVSQACPKTHSKDQAPLNPDKPADPSLQAERPASEATQVTGKTETHIDAGKVTIENNQSGLRREWNARVPSTMCSHHTSKVVERGHKAQPHAHDKPERHMLLTQVDRSAHTQKGLFQEAYVQGALIGNGGYGTVYAGLRKSDNKPVALKIVHQRKIKMWAKLSEHEDALPLEIALLRQVCSSPTCKSIAQLLDYYRIPTPEGGLYVMVLDRPIPCLDLFNYLQQKGGYLEEGLARHVMKQVVAALQHCHLRGVVHRDLKPENILVQMVTQDIKLLDFGSASVLKQGTYTDVAGTPEYFPPETVQKGEYFAVPATVWSLGILLFQMIWGDVPFYSKTSIINATLYFPRGISRDCRHLIRKCLSVCPAERPTLEQILEHPWMQ